MTKDTLCKFHLPIRTINPVNNSHGHWATVARRRRCEKHMAWAVMPKVTLPIVVKMTRISAGTLDDDNLRPTLKAIRDGIAAKLGVPDNDPRIVWEYDQRKGKKGTYGVDVEILKL